MSIQAIIKLYNPSCHSSGYQQNNIQISLFDDLSFVITLFIFLKKRKLQSVIDNRLKERFLLIVKDLFVTESC